MQQSNAIRADDWKATLVGEVLLFNLLGKIIYAPPDCNWLQSLFEDDIFSDSPLGRDQADVTHGLQLIQTWYSLCPGEITPSICQDLNADYTRLFIGAGKVLAPPWESVYFSKERLVFQEQTLQVRNWYRRFGLQAENYQKEPDDHLALELAFVTHLAQCALKALREYDEPTFQEMMEAQCRFLSEHLLKWAPLCCSLVIENAKTDFYRGIGFLTKGALLEMASILNLEIPTEVQW
jgi:TorA maturation chaperone TorD